MGACEMTHFMLQDVLRRNPTMRSSRLALKPGNYDGSVVLYDATRLTLLSQFTKRLLSNMVQVALVCKFRDEVMQTEFSFTVLHLKSDGMEDNGALESVRVRQARAALDLLETSSSPLLPKIVVGDFNSDGYLVKKWKASHTPHVQRVFEDAHYESFLPTTVPTYLHFGTRCFDYIMGSPMVHSLHRSQVPIASSPCPNATQGSDHLPIYAEVFVE